MIFVSSITNALEIKFPADFFAEQISGAQCITHVRWRYDEKGIASLDANKMMEHNTSLAVTHNELSYRWSNILSKTYTAIAKNDLDGIKDVIKTLLFIAERNALLNTKNVEGKCWQDGNKNAKCGYHTMQHTGFAFNAMVMSATTIKEHLTKDELNVLNIYFKKGYEKFIEPNAIAPLNSKGIYEFADNGISVLAYAHWTNDKKLAERELKRRHKDWLKKISDYGLLNQNSYRGHRSYWYHTLGANSVFGYALIAREFGWDFFTDSELGPKLRALAESVYAGDRDIKVFLDLPFSAKNAIKDIKDARHHMHQLSLGLPIILKNEYNMLVGNNPIYQHKSSRETVDRQTGFNAECYYSSIKKID